MSYRILIPDELPYSNGVENVASAIVEELLPQVESVTWMLQDPERAKRIQRRLRNAENLNIIPFTQWNSAPSRTPRAGILKLLKAGLKKMPGLGRGAAAAYRNRVDSRIASVAKETRATHCWFHFVQGQSVPRLTIPVLGLVHDQNFRFFPENLPPGKPRQFERALGEWLCRADLLTVLSEAGRREMLDLNNNPHPRIEIIPNATTLPTTAAARPHQRKAQPEFFYPAAALSHKNHIALFKAAKELAEANHCFKIVLCGEDTDKLVQKQPMGNAGAEQARAFYEANAQLLDPHVEALGQCSMDTVEDHYASCSAVVLPSLYEGFGLPLVEALARSTPVLCNRIIPFEEQVTRYAAEGWVQWFKSDHVASVVQTIQNTINHPDSLPCPPFPVKNLEAWTWKDVSARYMKLFEELSHAQAKEEQGNET